VKSYVIENALSRHFYAFCRRLMRINLKLNCLQGLFYPFFTMLTKVVTVLLVIFSGIIILRPWGTLSVADFVSFMWIQSYIFFPLLMLAWVLPIYERGRAAYDRLLEIYEEPIEVQEGKHVDLTIPPRADIRFEQLSFYYPDTIEPALSDITLTIKGGSFVGITGPIGAGKSTLFRLLNREYEIASGMIFIGGRDIHDYPLESFCRSVVTVEQSPFLFSRTIADNVKVGREDATREDLEMVSKYADLHETILAFPDQYDTVIGERGVTLSGGQKQRVAMARAFLVNRSILLLDDIFSAVDAATEKRIFLSMKERFKNKTILLITHRVSVLEGVDRILYMKGGRLVEDGTHAELVKKKGFYAALVELQSRQYGV
jgi:ATP-binding cassette subfamily B protein